MGKNIAGGTISPSGKQAVLEARGEVFSLPAEHGVVRNLTRTSGIAERHPEWSPDGKRIAYFSDRSGEYELVVRPADGSGGEETLTSLGAGYRYTPWWSPDSTKIVFIDNLQVIHLLDVVTRNVTEIDRGRWMTHPPLENFSVSWSTDSRWIAYSRGLDNRQSAVFLYDTQSDERHQVTSGFVDCSGPVFDPEGKYLYYLSDRSFDASYSAFEPTWIYANPTNLVAVPLRKDVASPLAPRNDVEGTDAGDDEKKEGKEGGETDSKTEKGSDAAKKKEPVKIDLEGFEARAVVLPPDAGNYSDLAAVEGKLLYSRHPRTGSDGESSPLLFWDLEDREEKTILDDADSFEVSANGSKILVAAGGTFAIVDVAPGQKLDKALATGSMEMMLVPPEEWRQIFTEAWRLERDYFYDPNMHGVDWPMMRDRYGALLDDVVSRWDLNFIIGELIGELNTSHSYRGGGDTEKAASRGVGLLGVDWELADGAYRIQRIITAAPWDTETRSPLAEPGVAVAEGDWVLAVNGIPIDVAKDPWAAFEGLADTTVMLTVNDKPTMEGAREVLIETLSSEARLRNLAWIESNRQNGRGGHRRPRGVHLRALHRDRRADRALPDVPRPVRKGRADRRRTVQRRRPDSGSLCRAPQPAALQLLGGQVRHRLADAGDRPGRTQGHADQRVERFGGRRFPLLLPRGGARTPDRHQDLGRVDRLLRLPGAD